MGWRSPHRGAPVLNLLYVCLAACLVLAAFSLVIAGLALLVLTGVCPLAVGMSSMARAMNMMIYISGVLALFYIFLSVRTIVLFYRGKNSEKS